MVEDMAMLELIRKHRSLFSIIFILSAAGLVISMFGAPGRSGGMGGGMYGGTIAKVEGEEINTRELIERLSQQMQQAETMLDQQSKGNPESRKFLEQYMKSQISPDRVLQQLIQQRFLVSTAEVTGMAASPDSIRAMILKDPEFQADGSFSALIYKQRVVEPGKYEADLAKQVKFTNLSRAFESGLGLISPLEKEEEAKLNTKYSFETLSVEPKQFPEPKVASEEDIKSYLAKKDSSTKLKSYFDRQADKYQSSEQVHARHILVKENEGGEKKIREVQAEIKSGKISFEEAAKKYSSDKSNAPKGGDLGFFAKETMDPAFSDAAFKMTKAGDVSDPVKSSFGYHLIQFVERKPAVKTDFEKVKGEIAAVLALEDKKSESAKAWIAQWSDGKSSPSDAQLKKLGFTWTKQADWSPLDEQLGSVGSVDTHLSDLVALNESHRMLKNPITQGEKLIFVRWLKTTSAGDAAIAKTKDVAKKVEKKADKPSPYKLEQEKAQGAFQYFLQSRFESLEKQKKIIRSEKALSQLRTQFQRQSSGG